MKFSNDQRASLRKQLAKATDDEFEQFIATCQRTGLDPYARQIMASFRWNKDAQREVMSVAVTIDGFRSIAAATGKYRGQNGPFWCGQDGKWVDVWLDPKNPPAAAKVEVVHADFANPLTSVATWQQYVQTTKDGHPNRMWAQMGPMMLAKCAESLALRRAFPDSLSGVYTTDEMGQADNHDTPAAPTEAPRSGTERAKAALAAKGLPIGTGAQVPEKIGIEKGNKMMARLAELAIDIDDVRLAIREQVPDAGDTVNKSPDRWPADWLAVVTAYVRDIEKTRESGVVDIPVG